MDDLERLTGLLTIVARARAGSVAVPALGLVVEADEAFAPDGILPLVLGWAIADGSRLGLLREEGSAGALSTRDDPEALLGTRIAWPEADPSALVILSGLAARILLTAEIINDEMVLVLTEGTH